MQSRVNAVPSGTAVVAAPPGRIANDAERQILTEAESTRMSLLSKALPLVSDLLGAITMGDPAVQTNPRGAAGASQPGLEVTKRAAYSHLGIFPNTYDWLNDPADKKAYDTITVAARLMSVLSCHAPNTKWRMSSAALGRPIVMRTPDI